MAITPNKTADFFINEVVSSYIYEKYREKMVFRPYATINTDLKGVSGDTLTIPKVKKVIDDATDVNEGEAIPFDTIGTEKTTVKIKKIARGISFTTEALTRGFGNIQSLGLDNLAFAMANKIDNDCLATLKTKTVYFDVSAEKKISRDVLSDALTGFGEREAEDEKILYVHPLQVAELRNDPNFLTANEVAQNMIIRGSIGMIWGMNIVPTEKLEAESTKYTNIIMKRGALGIAEKRDLIVESDKDIKTDVLNIVATQHYATYLLDESKIVVFETKADETAFSKFTTHKARMVDTVKKRKGF